MRAQPRGRALPVSLLAAVCLLAADRPAAPAQQTMPATRAARRPAVPIARGGCVTAACHAGLKSQAFTHGPVSVDACDACHRLTDPARHAFELVRPGAALCGFCHQLEPAGPQVHQPFKQGQCVACHDPHGGANRFMLPGSSVADSCRECHDDVGQDLPAVHGPVAAGACTACHQAHSAPNPKLLTATGRALCLGCHQSLRQRLEGVKTVHKPVATDCAACHAAHAAEQPMMLKADTTELCLSCHADIKQLLAGARVGHAPVTSGPACRNCHDPHGSDQVALLRDQTEKVCLTCHDRPIELAGGGRLANMQALLAPGRSRHGPVAEGRCAVCHQVHGSEHFRLLVAEYPAQFYAPFSVESYALCFECHDEELVLEPQTDELTGFRNGRRNLHYLHVNKQTKGRTCRACHEVHASRYPKQVRDAVPFGRGRWELPTNFVKTDSGGRCSPGCHRPYAYDRVNPVTYGPRAAPASRAAPVATQAARGDGRQ